MRRRWPTRTDSLAPAAAGRARGRARRSCPSAPAEEMRDLLPAIEPERRLNDWGRSERVEGVMDRTLVEFFYRYWFRAEVEGIENVPAEGGALLVSNHSGALPPGRGDDRQGDPRGAPEPAPALPHGRALLQGLSRASRC